VGSSVVGSSDAEKKQPSCRTGSDKGHMSIRGLLMGVNILTVRNKKRD
jgi:hypothetical protein